MWTRACGLILLSAVAASAGIEHTILNGVSVGRVRAWVGPERIAGLTAERLNGIAESRLAEAGIAVGDGEAALTLAASAYGNSGSCFVSVEGRLTEPARLERNGMSVAAASWHRGATVIASKEECAEHTVGAVEKVLADFVESYRAMNPGRASER